MVEVDGYKYHQTFLFYKNFVSNLLYQRIGLNHALFLLNKISGYFLTPTKYYRTVLTQLYILFLLINVNLSNNSDIINIKLFKVVKICKYQIKQLIMS